MVTVDTRVFDIFSPDLFREAGWYMVDNPAGIAIGASMDVSLNPAYIIGSAPYDWTTLKSELDVIELTVDGRENFPVKASSDQMIAIVEGVNRIRWKRMDEIQDGDLIAVPAYRNGWWAFSPSRVKSLKKVSVDRSKWGTYTLVTLAIKDNVRTYSAVGGLLHV